jgi:hypothetical protein
MSVMDERTDLVVSFLDSLWERLAADPMFAATNEEQREEARVAVERAIFSQVQTHHNNYTKMTFINRVPYRTILMYTSVSLNPDPGILLNPDPDILLNQDPDPGILLNPDPGILLNPDPDPDQDFL